MPNSLGDFVWFLMIFVLGITATLVGILYKGVESRLNEHDTRIRHLEITINDQLKRIAHKLGIE
jgi:hypothetical protein